MIPNGLIKILVCFGITVIAINLYLLILMVCFGKLHEALNAGTSVIIGIVTIALFPFYRSEAIEIWKNIKQNYKNRKGR